MNLHNLGIALNYDSWLWFPRESHFSEELPKQILFLLSLQTTWSHCTTGNVCMLCQRKAKATRNSFWVNLMCKTILFSPKLQSLTTAENLVPWIQWKFSMWLKYAVTYTINMSFVSNLYRFSNSFCGEFTGLYFFFFYYGTNLKPL